MITYIVKTLLCGAVLFLIYALLLEREKMHRFNRFYLLFSIVFSFGVSFLTIKSQLPLATVNEMIMPASPNDVIAVTSDLKQAPASSTQTTATAPIKESNQLVNILLGLYIAVTAFLLFRFIRNLSMLLYKIIHNKSVAYHGASLVLTNDNAVPHSFMNYIFIDQNKFEQGVIEKEILRHELTHVNQKHSIDILMIELILVFAWINPLLLLYRRAILLNHEYLADEAVIKTFNDTQSYQLLLFHKASQSKNLVLSSSFNYLITKKRLIMMTRKTSQRVAILKQIALIPLIAAIGFLFSTRVIAQDNLKQPVTQKQLEVSKTDAPQSVVNEFHAILRKYKIDTLTIKTLRLDPKNNQKLEIKKWLNLTHLDSFAKVDTSVRNRLGLLYSQMSDRQHKHTFIAFLPKHTLKTKIVPTKTQFEAWKNPKTYGVWINGKRAKNSILNNHSNTDYAYFALRNLDKDAVKIMKYQIEVALLTKGKYEKERTRIAMESKDPCKYIMALKAPRMLSKDTDEKKK
jgi:bla regulator protein BlaR1